MTMDPYAITLADIIRILEALDQAGGERLIQGLKDRVPIPAIEHGRTTLGMVMQLLRQTGGSTTLPDEIAALLQQITGLAVTTTAADPFVPPQGVFTLWTDIGNAITGHRRISVEQVERCLNVGFSTAQRLQLQRVPFAKKTLEACNKTHVLFPGYPVTLAELCQRLPDGVLRRATREAILNSSPYRTQCMSARWYLLRCGIAPGSTFEDYAKQLERMPNHEEVPQLVEVLYGMVLKYLLNGDHLFHKYYVRCAQVPTISRDEVMVVGMFTKEGSAISARLINARDEDLGIAAMRKLHT